MNVIEIKKRNLELGLTAKDWAKCLEISVQHAYRKLNGKSVLTLEQACKISSLLQIKDEDLGLYFLKGGSRVS